MAHVVSVIQITTSSTITAVIMVTCFVRAYPRPSRLVSREPKRFVGRFQDAAIENGAGRLLRLHGNKGDTKSVDALVFLDATWQVQRNYASPPKDVGNILTNSQLPKICNSVFSYSSVCLPFVCAATQPIFQ